MSTKLFVGNLAFQTTNQQLQDLFAQAGTVQSANIIEDHDTGRSRGFAFVEMSTNAEAAAAIDADELAAERGAVGAEGDELSTSDAAAERDESSLSESTERQDGDTR